jgi:hypothetical protein
MTELKERLAELQGQYSELAQLYESLQLECSTVKQELGTLRRGNIEHESVSPPIRSYYSGPEELEESLVETSNQLLFDVSTFLYNQEEEGRPEETNGLSPLLR